MQERLKLVTAQMKKTINGPLLPDSIGVIAILLIIRLGGKLIPNSIGYTILLLALIYLALRYAYIKNNKLQKKLPWKGKAQNNLWENHFEKIKNTIPAKKLPKFADTVAKQPDWQTKKQPEKKWEEEHSPHLHNNSVKETSSRISKEEAKALLGVKKQTPLEVIKPNNYTETSKEGWWRYPKENRNDTP